MRQNTTREFAVTVRDVPFRVVVEMEPGGDWYEREIYVDDSERDVSRFLENSPEYMNIIQAVGMEIDEYRHGGYAEVI